MPSAVVTMMRKRGNGHEKAENSEHNTDNDVGSNDGNDGNDER